MGYGVETSVGKVTISDDSAVNYNGAGKTTDSNSKKRSVEDDVLAGVKTTSGSVVVFDSEVCANFGNGIETETGDVELYGANVSENSAYGVYAKEGDVVVRASSNKNPLWSEEGWVGGSLVVGNGDGHSMQWIDVDPPTVVKSIE